MKLQADADDLFERIRREARRHQLELSPDSSVDADTDPSVLPPAPVFKLAPPGGFTCESLLAQSAAMVDRARGKTTVRKAVPKILRPLWRNQGGYNDIVLETLERLREANAALMSENAQLRGHVHRQTAWMRTAGRLIAGLETRVEALERPVPEAAP